MYADLREGYIDRKTHGRVRSPSDLYDSVIPGIFVRDLVTTYT